MNPRDPAIGAASAAPKGLAHSHFSVQEEPPAQRLLAWRNRVGHVIDVLHSSSDLDQPFQAAIDRYDAGGLVFTDCRSDAMVLDRSLARISRDPIRDYAFHVFVEGGVNDMAVRGKPRDADASATSVLALDMSQPVRMHRTACRVLTFFVPGTMVAEVFPDPEAIHGRTIRNTTPLARLAIEHAMALGQNISALSAPAAESAMRTGTQLLVSAFGKQAGLSGNARAAARAAMFGRVRRYVQVNLHRAELSPELILNALQLPRPTLYRMFQHEGGLGAYIRNLRLRHAASDLARYPHLMVTDIAYSVGFKSASDFTRAFRRAYGMAPQDFRVLSLKVD